MKIITYGITTVVYLRDYEDKTENAKKEFDSVGVTYRYELYIWQHNFSRSDIIILVIAIPFIFLQIHEKKCKNLLQ